MIKLHCLLNFEQTFCWYRILDFIYYLFVKKLYLFFTKMFLQYLQRILNCELNYVYNKIKIIVLL